MRYNQNTRLDRTDNHEFIKYSKRNNGNNLSNQKPFGPTLYDPFRRKGPDRENRKRTVVSGGCPSSLDHEDTPWTSWNGLRNVEESRKGGGGRRRTRCPRKRRRRDYLLFHVKVKDDSKEYPPTVVRTEDTRLLGYRGLVRVVVLYRMSNLKTTMKTKEKLTRKDTGSGES